MSKTLFLQRMTWRSSLESLNLYHFMLKSYYFDTVLFLIYIVIFLLYSVHINKYLF